MRLWGAPFLIVGSYMLVGRFLADAWVCRRLHCFVTNHRIVIRRSGWRDRERSFTIGWLPIVKLTDRPDGSGDIRFSVLRYGRGKSGRHYKKDQCAPALSPVRQFLAIADAAEVAALIERLRAEAESSSTAPVMVNLPQP